MSQSNFNGENVMEESTLQTPTIGKLAMALSKAQGEIEGAAKDRDNPFFKSKYADLHSCILAARDALSKNELAVIQTTKDSDLGITIVTTLAHSSGEWMRGLLTMKPKKDDDQGRGSSITYGRRYAYAAIIGLAQMDDDGNAATKPPKDQQPGEKPPTKVKSTYWEKKFEAAGIKNLDSLKKWRSDNGKKITETIESDGEAKKLKLYLNDYEKEYTPKETKQTDASSETANRDSVDAWLKWIGEYKVHPLEVYNKSYTDLLEPKLENFPEAHRNELIAANADMVKLLTEKESS